MATVMALALRRLPKNAVVDKAPIYDAEKQLLVAVNTERRRFGLVELVLDPHRTCARRHCGWMANARSMVHSTDPGAENIAMGFCFCGPRNGAMDEFVRTSGEHPQSRLHQDWTRWLYFA